jgi:hypothetical protein
MVQLARQRPRVDQLLWIDAGGGAPGQVADIVGSGPAGSFGKRCASLCAAGGDEALRMRADAR